MWKEVIVASFGALSLHLPCGTNEKQEWYALKHDVQFVYTEYLVVIQSVSLVWQREVVPGVKGLLWGSYVGSPADPDPVVVWKHQHRTPVASLVPLLTNDVFGLAPQTSLLLKYSKEKGNAKTLHIFLIYSWPDYVTLAWNWVLFHWPVLVRDCTS